MKRILALGCLLALVACGRTIETQPAQAQAIGPGSPSRIHVLDGGLCTGIGTTTDPFRCDVAVGAGVAGTGSAGSPLSAGGGGSIVTFGLMGDGSDGAFTFDGVTTFTDRRGVAHVPVSNVYTMTNDVFCNSCTVNVGVSVRPAGFRFYDRGTLTLNGKIERNGNNASGATAGASTEVANTFLNAGGSAGGNGAAGGGAACAAGVATADSVASSGAAGLTCLNTGGAAGAPGQAGGACKGGGGGNGGNGTGCAAGNIFTFNPASSGANFRMFYDALLGRFAYLGAGSTRTYAGGSGGGGGRGASTPTAFGGGGGGGGGVVHVYAGAFAGTGSVEARGGNGGNGEATNATGGGGGGGGGVAFVIVASGSCPTIDVSGGTGGTGGPGGSNGGTGGAGISRCIQMR